MITDGKQGKETNSRQDSGTDPGTEDERHQTNRTTDNLILASVKVIPFLKYLIAHSLGCQNQIVSYVFNTISLWQEKRVVARNCFQKAQASSINA